MKHEPEIVGPKELLPHVEAFDRLDTFLAEGRLLRGAWSDMPAAALAGEEP